MSSYTQQDPDWLTYGDDMYFAECSENCTECHPGYDDDEEWEDVEDDSE